MIERIIGIYYICDEAVKFFGLKDDPQQKMTTSELMTFAFISSIYFGCDYKKSRLVCINLRFFKKVLSHSRIVRRLHEIPEGIWILVCSLIRMLMKKQDSEYFIVDSFPIGAYQNYKSFRARIFKGKLYHGYTASKKSYFFGLKVHMIVDEYGFPVEFCITPGSTSDIEGLKNLPCELPFGSILIGDKAYTNYSLEDDLLEMMGISFIPKRRNKLKRQNSRLVDYIYSQKRNKIETTFSSIMSRVPRHIKARTEKGFYLKVIFFILAYVVERYLDNIAVA